MPRTRPEKGARAKERVADASSVRCLRDAVAVSVAVEAAVILPESLAAQSWRTFWRGIEKANEELRTENYEDGNWVSICARA